MFIVFVLESLLHKKDPQTKSLEGIIDPSLEIRILVSFCFYIHTLWCISLATCGRVYYKAVLEADSLCNFGQSNVTIVWFQHACCPFYLKITFLKASGA